MDDMTEPLELDAPDRVPGWPHRDASRKREIALLNRALGRRARKLKRMREAIRQMKDLIVVQELLLDEVRQAAGLERNSMTSVVERIRMLRNNEHLTRGFLGGTELRLRKDGSDGVADNIRDFMGAVYPPTKEEKANAT